MTTHEPIADLVQENERLRADLESLRERLREPEDLLHAIRFGEVDGFVVTERGGEAIYHLKSADLLCRLIIEHMRDGALAVDAAGIVLHCNLCFAKMMGAVRREILGSRVQRFLAPEARPIFQELMERAEAGARGDLDLQAVSGERLPTAMSVQLLSVYDQPVYGVVVSDLTPERRRERLELEARRKDEFLAVLGHELRGPLEPLANAVRLLELHPDDGRRARWTRDVIERQVSHLTRLVDDLLDLGRIGRGKLEIRLERHDLASVVARAVETSRAGIEARGHQLLARFEEGLPADVDPHRLTQVVANLLNNAAKFTPPGGRIWVELERLGDEAALRVRDTGIGLRPDQLAQIFDLYAQVERPPASGGGLGIGLALVRRLVEMHGGAVAATSDGPGKGAELVVRIPLSTANDRAVSCDVGEVPRERASSPAEAKPLDSAKSGSPHAAARATGGPGETPGSDGRRLVLLVDDHDDARETLSQLVRLWGHELHTAADGPSGLEACSTFVPDVVIVDIGLPGMDGYELARRLRERPELSHATLIALTGHGLDEARRRSAEAGIDHHLVKPADPDRLRALIAAERRSARPPSPAESGTGE